MPVDVDSAEAIALKAKVDDQGNKVRDLKTGDGEKSDIDVAVQVLLQLKAEYKSLTGVDLGGGGGKKAKKEKKAAAKAEPAEKQAPAEKKAKASKQQQEAPKGESVQTAQNTARAAVERDMSMNAVLGRLAQRASQADTIIAQLKAQLSAVRQTAALSACKAEEQRLKSENESLKNEVQTLKERLVQAEIQGGVVQVPLPKKSSAASSAPAPKIKPVAKQQQPVAKQQQQPPNKDKQAAKEDKPKKQEKKENKPKAAAGGSADAESKGVDISRIDMRIGKIVNVQRHPEADTLYLEEVDVGEGKNRTILSGLVKHVPEDKMRDRIAIFMCNLKPAKMRGIFSEGMIMCGSTPEKVEIIEPPTGVSVGDKVYVEGYEGTPDTQLNPKKKIFEQVQPDLRISPEGVATYKGVPWKVKGIEGLCTVPTMRDTPIK